MCNYARKACLESASGWREKAQCYYAFAKCLYNKGPSSDLLFDVEHDGEPTRHPYVVSVPWSLLLVTSTSYNRIEMDSWISTKQLQRLIFFLNVVFTPFVVFTDSAHNIFFFFLSCPIFFSLLFRTLSPTHILIRLLFSPFAFFLFGEFKFLSCTALVSLLLSSSLAPRAWVRPQLVKVARFRKWRGLLSSLERILELSW